MASVLLLVAEIEGVKLDYDEYSIIKDEVYLLLSLQLTLHDLAVLHVLVFLDVVHILLVPDAKRQVVGVGFRVLFKVLAANDLRDGR